MAEAKDKLFFSLGEASMKRRPQLCSPILEEIAKYTLDDEDEKLFQNVSSLIKRYKFDKVKELINAK